MSITTTATILVRLNNGATQSGGITASPGDVVQLVAASYAGWGSPAPRWEILTYPSTWATPSGWTKDTASGAIYFLGTNPPPFTLPSSGDVLNGMFGVWRLALTVNEGDRPDLVDKNKTAIELISANGVRDVAFGERFEFDPIRSHAAKIEVNNRILDETVGAMVSVGPTVPAVVSATTGAAGASSTAARSDHSHQLTESVFRTVANGLAAPLLVQSGIRASFVQFDAQQDLARSIPLNWSACKVGGVVSWSINDTSDLVNDVVDPFANLNIECYFPNGCKITKVHIWNKGPGGGGNPLPANPPSFYLYRKPLATGIPALLATVNATLDGTYRGTRRKITLDISGAPHTVDAAANRYYIVVTPEFGADALVGGLVQGAEVERNFPANYAIGLE